MSENGRWVVLNFKWFIERLTSTFYWDESPLEDVYKYLQNMKFCHFKFFKKYLMLLFREFLAIMDKINIESLDARG